tara:strand:- start:4736 stop:6106 length:1371 start_codon:yes stop_codon:yes gene_type:complete
MIVKKNIYKYYFLFLLSHILIWVLVPSFSNINLPLDTIEALAWGSNLDWGFNKHPPFSAFAVEIIYYIFGNQDWAYYFLSQIFIIVAFIFIFKFAKEFFKNSYLAFLSILLLEGIFYYNYTSPEFNVNVSQLPFWALSIFFTFKCIKNDRSIDYVFLGLFMGLGLLSKYLFLFLIAGINFLFIYLVANKKIKTFNFLIIFPSILIIVFPHYIWLSENNFVTFSYGIQRTGGIGSFADHIIFPITFLFKQLGILSPFFLLFFFLLDKRKIKKIKIDSNLIFLIFTFLIPIILMLLTSLIMGAKIRTMWMTPFYLLAGVTLIEIFKKNIIKNITRKFFFLFLFLFFISPISYFTVSITNDFKRTDYPGNEIARLVQNRWDDNFTNEIKFVVGDEWFAGNLSYHLKSRPKWVFELKEKSNKIKSGEGVIYAGNPKILRKICPGVYGTIKPVGYCMIGQK